MGGFLKTWYCWLAWNLNLETLGELLECADETENEGNGRCLLPQWLEATRSSLDGRLE